jgi:uncharacterized membrane protein HdeD (DUF308 family)
MRRLARPGLRSWAATAAESGPFLSMTTGLTQNWRIIAVRGGIGVVSGIFALTTPAWTDPILIVCFATYLFLDGVFAIEAGLALSVQSDCVELILEGAVNLLAGSVALILPIAAPCGLAWLIGGWAIVSGALPLIAAMRIHRLSGRGFLIFGGVTSTSWGVGLMMTSPASASIIAGWLGSYALAFGTALLGLAFRLREQHQASC